MDEKLLAADPRIIEKLIQHIDGQSSLFEATVPVATGALIAVIAVFAGSWLNDCLARRRQCRDLHREKLEDAVQVLLSLRRWALTSAHDVKAMLEGERETGSKAPIEEFTKTAKHFAIEGRLVYEEALALLEIYSGIKSPGKELHPKLAQFENALEKWMLAGAIAKSPESKQLDKAHDEFETACNNLMKKAKDKILNNYMP